MTDLTHLLTIEATAIRALGVATVAHGRAREAMDDAAKVAREATASVNECVRRLRDAAAGDLNDNQGDQA